MIFRHFEGTDGENHSGLFINYKILEVLGIDPEFFLEGEFDHGVLADAERSVEKMPPAMAEARTRMALNSSFFITYCFLKHFWKYSTFIIWRKMNGWRV